MSGLNSEDTDWWWNQTSIGHQAGLFLSTLSLETSQNLEENMGQALQQPSYYLTKCHSHGLSLWQTLSLSILSKADAT